MRVLVITHGNDAIYGAATSLKMLLQNCGWDFDLVYFKGLFHNTTDENMRNYTAHKAGKVQAFFLPFIWGSVIEDVRIRILCSYQIRKLFIFMDGFRLKKRIRDGHYDYILLNSLVLYPLIDRKNKYIVYIREMCVAGKGLKKRVVRKLNQADKLIYIDPALKKPLREVTTESIVVNNPFDMSKLAMLDSSEIFFRFPKLDTKKIVISLIGIVDPLKGTDFVINTFKQVNRKNVVLAVVGTGNNAGYIAECEKSAQGYDNIVFLGEQKEMGYVYLASDYVLRADPCFVTGRTVYEGLYAGCNVIIQSDSEKDKNLFQEYEVFKDKIFFYKTRNKKSLLELIENLPNQKIQNRTYKSNVEEYVRKVNDFITRE